MTRCNKKQDANVMGRLASIAYRNVKKVGLFSQPPTSYLLLLIQVGIFHSRAQGRGELREGWREKLSVREEQGGEGREEQGRMLQTGIIRTNCVDCLDRWDGVTSCRPLEEMSLRCNTTLK